MVLLDLSNFSEVQEIRTALQKMGGVQRVLPLEEAPGVITWEIQADEPGNQIVENLRGVFGNKYSIREKTLPSGVTEINLAREP